MKKTFRLLLLFTVFFWSSFSWAQVEEYKYSTPLLDAKKGWNVITLPVDIFSKTEEDLSDLRIIRTIPSSQKEIEQPFILDVQQDRTERVEVDFKIINTTSKRNVFSYTFQLSKEESVNNIHLDFANENFDWYIHLEGSMNQESWSSITHNYRITSLSNSQTNFSYSDLKIPESKFNFYRISFHSEITPILERASISRIIFTESSLAQYKVKSRNIEENKKRKATIISLEIDRKLPTNQIEIHPTGVASYHRPIKIEGVIDSFQTGDEWKFRYTLLYQGSISSEGDNVFSFYNRRFNKFRITINNFEDQALSFGKFDIRGPHHRLITKLDDTENIVLCYGKKGSNLPIYDISYFRDKIPDKLNKISLGDEIRHSGQHDDSGPLLKNKWWLWGILILIILLLGSFTIKMLKDTK